MTVFINLSGDHCTPLILYPDRKGLFVLGSAETLYQNDKFGGWSKFLEHMQRNGCLRTAWLWNGALQHSECSLPPRRSHWRADAGFEKVPRSRPPRFNAAECLQPCEINPENSRQAFGEAKQAVKEVLGVPFFCEVSVLRLWITHWVGARQ